MTISTSTSKISYNGNGSTVLFTIPFYFIQDSDIKATKKDASDVETVFVLATDYTLSGEGVLSGGSLTTIATLASGESITIERNVALTQSTDYKPYGRIPADTLEQDIDKLTMISQQIQSEVDRTPKLETTSTQDAIVIEDPVSGAYLRYDANGNIINGSSSVENSDNYTYPDANALTRTLNQKMSDIISIADFGAVSDGDGKPLIVYHTTQANFNTFDLDKSTEGLFWFTSDKKAIESGETGADRMAGKESYIKEVYLSSQKMAGWDEYDSLMTDELIQLGYDGIKLDDNYVVFEPNQIKSVDNQGTFSKTDNNILKMAMDESPIITNDKEGFQKQIKILEAKYFNDMNQKESLTIIDEFYGDESLAISKVLEKYEYITRADAEDLYSAYGREIEYLMNNSEGVGDLSRLKEDALKTVQDSINEKAHLEKREGLFDIRSRMSQMDMFEKSANKLDAPIATLTGEYRKFKKGKLIGGGSGGMLSVKSIGNGKTGKYQGGFFNDLRRSNLKDVWADPANEEQIFTATWELSSGKDLSTDVYPQEIIDIANTMIKYNEISRIDFNEQGGWVGKLKGYVAGQSHDMFTIDKKGGKNGEVWISYMKDSLDIERSFGTGLQPDEIDKILFQLWNNFSTGNHMKIGNDVSGNSIRGASGVSKKLSKSRKLFFKDAKSDFDYGKTWGSGNLQYRYLSGLERMGKSNGLISKLGPSHELNFKSVLDTIEMKFRDDVDRKLSKKFGLRRERAEQILSYLDGRANIPTNHMLAKVNSSLRQMTILSSLGGVLLSQFNDIPVALSEARFQGMSTVKALHNHMEGLLDFGRADDARYFGEAMGLVTETTIGDGMSRIDAPELHGYLTEATNNFIRYTGMNYWTNSMRTSSAIGFSNYYANNSHLSFDGLNTRLKNLFTDYDITPADWDVIRKSGFESLPDGRKILLPEKIELSNYEAGTKYRAMLMDRVYTSVVEPDARTRSKFRAKGGKGTFYRELSDHMMQFKTFAVGLANQVYRRDIARGDYSGMIQNVAFMSVMGMFSYQVKNIAKNRTPLDPVEYPMELIAAGLAQGGGFGIFGDFMFSEQNRFGGGLGQTLAGPNIGKAIDFAELGMSVTHGNAKAKQLYSTALHNTPYNNLFYIRPILNFLLLDFMYNMVDDGYFKRLEKRLDKTGQELIIQPNI